MMESLREEIKHELLAASKTWERFAWETPATEVQTLTPARPRLCLICDQPLFFLLYPAPACYPVMAGCLTCNLTAQDTTSFDCGHPSWSSEEQRIQRAIEGACQAYHKTVVRIAQDIPGYVQFRYKAMKRLRREESLVEG